jgi:hypothetical protein
MVVTKYSDAKTTVKVTPSTLVNTGNNILTCESTARVIRQTHAPLRFSLIDFSNPASPAWSALLQLMPVVWFYCLFSLHCHIVFLCSRMDEYTRCHSNALSITDDEDTLQRPLIGEPSWIWMSTNVPLNNKTLDSNITKVFERAPGLRRPP